MARSKLLVRSTAQWALASVEVLTCRRWPWAAIERIWPVGLYLSIEDGSEAREGQEQLQVMGISVTEV